ncbi:hypothetical protein Q1695_012966 [Nippostrongylus brasiliensis]|nr:hypothetical protein Q1695_012966 [Nippostrongylus brasiliensis]
MYKHSGNNEFHDDFVLSQRPLSDLPYSSDSDQSEDSDAEFLVHPILRSLIKSKSAYSMPKKTPRLKTSKTAFEINLSKMWESTTEDEAPVANFTPELDQKWPEPDTPSPISRKCSVSIRKNSCWSSPPNIILGDSLSPQSPLGESICWSAPECLNEEDSSDREERLPRSCSCGEVDSASLEPNTPFLDSYPVIDGGHQVPSLCSIRLPSSSGSVAYSPSPPRPLSPVLGGPPSSALRIPGSRSMQLRPRPELSSFVDNSTSDDDSPQQDPWPQQEVWPEEDVMTRSLRTGWTAADTLSSHTDGYHRSRHNAGGLSTSRSMHSPLRHAPPELESSTRPLLDEVERRDLITRSAWIDRGSSILLQDQEARRMSAKPESWRGFRNGARCESQSDFRCDTTSEDSMRRSYTTEELKKERRKLPKRPDMQPFLSELPSSVLHSPVVCEGSECCRDDNGHLARNDESAVFYTPPTEHRRIE